MALNLRIRALRSLFHYAAKNECYFGKDNKLKILIFAAERMLRYSFLYDIKKKWL
jgi:hypothetical protein